MEKKQKNLGGRLQLTVIKNGPMPMYIQIADTIKQDIAQQKMKPGESIGSQRELIEKFGVSQVTVRQALNILEKEGLVVRKQGKGTFVKPVKVEQNLVNLQSLSHIIKESGFKPEVAVTKMETVAIPDNLKQLFNSNFSECLYIERVHVVKNKPIAFAKPNTLMHQPNAIAISDRKKTAIDKSPSSS